MADDVVEDTEVLYRSVRYEEVVPLPDGNWRLSSEAFRDRFFKPSVDREKLRNDPSESRKNPTDGIVKLIASEVRRVDWIIHNTSMPVGEHQPYRVFIIPRPIGDDDPDGQPPNPSHAQIETDPVVDNKSRFNKLKDALCRIAERHGWVIAPEATPPLP